MGINYREEVDSGFDRKRIVEANIIAFLREGIPTEIITANKEFNYRHYEMLNNLKKGYFAKELEVLEKFGGYSKELSEQIVPDRFSGVSHPIGGELYPMDEKEEKEKFAYRDWLIEEIEKCKALGVKKSSNEKDKILKEITDFKIKYPIVDNVVALTHELDALVEQNVSFTPEQYGQLFKKYALDIRKMQDYELIYEKYLILTEALNKAATEQEKIAKNGNSSKEMQTLIDRKNAIETEILQRNTKLINWFIRDRYGKVLVETDEIFQICYLAIWDAIKKFDYTKGKFSTFAVKSMDWEVRRNFKQLTGYKWEDYWTKRKIEVMVKTTSELLGRTVNVTDLVNYGLLDIGEKKALTILNLPVEYSFADYLRNDDNSYDEYEVDSEYNYYFGDDEIEDFSQLDNRIYEEDFDGEVIRESLKSKINDILNELRPREKLVISLRYGLDNGEPCTYDEIGNMLGVTRERIRQIELKGLRCLRWPGISKKISGFIKDEDISINRFSR